MAVTELRHDGAHGARTASPHVAPEIVRARTEVRCTDGSLRPSRYLDYAATAPALRAAADAALELLPYYGSIHRGAGVESATSTAAYEAARGRRGVVRRRGARPGRGVRPQHDRGAQPARPLPARERARALDAGRAPRQHAPLAAARGRSAAVHALGRRAAHAQCRGARERPLRPPRDLRCLQCHRGDPAGRASSPSWRTATAPRSASTRPSSHRTCRSTWKRSGSTISRSRATSSTRRSASAC